MQKTTVYLDDEEADGLRRLSQTTGRSQSELIREGVRRMVHGAPRRVFHSLGAGRGGGGLSSSRRDRTWKSDDLYARSFRAADGRPLRVAEEKTPPRPPPKKQA